MNIIDQIKTGIAHTESGGAKDPYKALGRTTSSGDRAYGKYQVMGNNIPQWTKEATGTAYTKDDFINNSDLQEKVATHKLSQYYAKYQNPDDVASVWFTGRPVDKAGKNVKDVNGTSNAQYINSVKNNMQKNEIPIWQKALGIETANAQTTDQPTMQSEMSLQDFGQKLKDKYPQAYGKYDAIELGKKALQKHPDWKSIYNIQDDSVPQTNASQTDMPQVQQAPQNAPQTSGGALSQFATGMGSSFLGTAKMIGDALGLKPTPFGQRLLNSANSLDNGNAKTLGKTAGYAFQASPAVSAGAGLLSKLGTKAFPTVGQYIAHPELYEDIVNAAPVAKKMGFIKQLVEGGLLWEGGKMGLNAVKGLFNQYIAPEVVPHDEVINPAP